MLRYALLTIVVTMSGILVTPPMDAEEIGIGVGESRKEGPQAAGREAAARAKADLGDHEARLVFVFDNVADNTRAKRKLMAGVAQEFPKELVFGCSAFSPLTTYGNAGTVGVLALGGDVEVATASAGIEQGQEAAGKVIARAIGDVPICIC